MRDASDTVDLAVTSGPGWIDRLAGWQLIFACVGMHRGAKVKTLSRRSFEVTHRSAQGRMKSPTLQLLSTELP